MILTMNTAVFLVRIVTIAADDTLPASSTC